jgi:phosphoserine phosphatase
MVVHKLKAISNENFKRMGVGVFLRGRSKEFIIKCAEEYAGRIKLNKVYDNEFKKYSKPYVISASFAEYIEPLFPGTHIIGSEIEFDNNRVKSLKKNCYGKVKCQVLRDIGINCIDILYTDSVSDLPLAQVSKEINFVKGDQIIKCNDLDHFIHLVA